MVTYLRLPIMKPEDALKTTELLFLSKVGSLPNLCWGNILLLYNSCGDRCRWHGRKSRVYIL